MKRREFIEQTTAAASFVTIGGLGLQSFVSAKLKHITILHTNDVHSHIDPFGPGDGRNANQGGVARRAAATGGVGRCTDPLVPSWWSQRHNF